MRVLGQRPGPAAQHPRPASAARLVPVSPRRVLGHCGNAGTRLPPHPHPAPKAAVGCVTRSGRLEQSAPRRPRTDPESGEPKPIDGQEGPQDSGGGRDRGAVRTPSPGGGCVAEIGHLFRSDLSPWSCAERGSGLRPARPPGESRGRPAPGPLRNPHRRRTGRARGAPALIQDGNSQSTLAAPKGALGWEGDLMWGASGPVSLPCPAPRPPPSPPPRREPGARR
ncbi:PREDICTED: proline-rich protein 2-like [Dipodomys ordii]|uniref:Proline-rich protein 2-like n=1 Tax=Dipodomys ordii TaxID=10020 RepID=A0A1S3FFF8_DIPOR|nr:PREDICTED: proline-rich protein 2-like [Dipodomys ordii]